MPIPLNCFEGTAPSSETFITNKTLNLKRAGDCRPQIVAEGDQTSFIGRTLIVILLIAFLGYFVQLLNKAADECPEIELKRVLISLEIVVDLLLSSQEFNVLLTSVPPYQCPLITCVIKLVFVRTLINIYLNI